MRVRRNTVVLELESNEIKAINTMIDVCLEISDLMYDHDANSVFDEEGFLLSKDNVSELREILQRLQQNSDRIEIGYCENVEELDKNR